MTRKKITILYPIQGKTFGGGHVTLEVAGSTPSQGGVFKTATSDSAGTGSSGTEMIMFTDNTKGAINVVSSDPLTFSTANAAFLQLPPQLSFLRSEQVVLQSDCELLPCIIESPSPQQQ